MKKYKIGTTQQMQSTQNPVAIFRVIDGKESPLWSRSLKILLSKVMAKRRTNCNNNEIHTLCVECPLKMSFLEDTFLLLAIAVQQSVQSG